jgi:membrane associated rhomboid family serine protease
MDGREGYVIIFDSPGAAECRERALVLAAMGFEHAIGRQDGMFVLAVPGHQEASADRELDLYEVETRDWPRRHSSPPRHAFGLTGAAGAVAVLLLAAAASGDNAFGFDWFRAGRIDTNLVRRGEWWRAVTALTLHVDVAHLAGNLVLGSVFGLIAGRVFGHGLAWFSIVIAGAIANEVSGLIQPSGHTAVGASTAVFAALGLLGAHAWRRRHEHLMPWGYLWAPFIVAAVLLAMMGSGGPRTDVVSHLIGFLAGSGLGAYYGSFSGGFVVGRRSQRALGVSTVVLVIASWAIALGAHG